MLQVGGGDSVIFALGDAVSLPWPEAKTIIAAKVRWNGLERH